LDFTKTTVPTDKSVGYFLPSLGLPARRAKAHHFQLCCPAINALILRACGYIFGCKIGKKTFQFLFARQMRWKPLTIVAISPEPSAVTALNGEGKMFAPKHFDKLTNSAFSIGYVNIRTSGCILIAKETRMHNLLDRYIAISALLNQSLQRTAEQVLATQHRWPVIELNY
jgi:hypothetical protein